MTPDVQPAATWPLFPPGEKSYPVSKGFFVEIGGQVNLFMSTVKWLSVLTLFFPRKDLVLRVTMDSVT